jgi:methyltransferase-like protein/SAM-dependent methyltransferase
VTTLASYDAIPYESIPITDTHVATLAATARLFGVETAQPDRCRVLELGCAEGGNLIPMAFYLPGSRFVGVDLSQTQIETGARFISELGLDNVRLLHRDVADGLADLGEFDFIIAHGLYSWVPQPVRQKILDICACQLAANGIAYISFNTLPGWRTRAMVRDMLLHHARGVAAPRLRLTRAYQFIEQYATAFQAMPGREAALVAEDLAYLREAPPSYVYHEYLEDTNEPMLFADFTSQAQSAGLRYVADTELHTMQPGTLPEAAREALSQIDDPLALEQAMDFLRNRRFRRTLLARADALAKAAPDMAVFRSFALYGELASDEEIDLASIEPQEFTTPTGARFAVRHPLAKAAVMLLAGRFPASMAFEELAEAASAAVREYGDAALAEDAAALQTELFSLAAYRALGFTLAPDSQPADLPGKPRAHALARLQAQHEQAAAGSRHTALTLDAHSARLLVLADGSRTLDELAAAMQGELPSMEADAVAARCQQLLWTFMRNGLLRG